MRRAAPVFFLILLLFVLARPAQADTGAAAGDTGGFSADLAADVYATALAFMAPRTLDPVGVEQLALWGLRGLTALDPSLTVELRDGSLRLVGPSAILFATTPPPMASADAWGAVAARMAASAWDASEDVRRAGTSGVIRSFFDELFNHLDPYSRYVPPLQAGEERDRRGAEAGAGLTLARQHGAIVVTSVAADGPGAAAGVLPGDEILAVGRRSTHRRAAETVGAWLAGPDDSSIRITLRTQRGRVHTVTLTRALVPPETVFAEREDGMLVVTITAFATDTAAHFEGALQAGLGSAGEVVRGLVIDLRDNRGGLLRQAAEVADSVLDSGLVLVTAGRDAQANHVWGASGGDMARGLPIIVLVDGRSASASEIVAAALQDDRRAVIVGSSTLGKGLVQTISPLPDGGELFITWSRVLAPRGWPIQGLGVLPQVCTSLGEASLEQQLAELAAGRQSMAAALAQHDAARAPIPAAQVIEIRQACPAAEGRDIDLDAAQFLIDHPTAYRTALLPPAAGIAAAAAARSGGAVP